MTGYIEKVRLHLHDMIGNLKKTGEWKIHLTMKPKFISLTDGNEKCAMYFKSDNSIVMIDNHTNKIIQKLFDSSLRKYQAGLEQSMRGSNFIFDYFRFSCLRNRLE